MNKNQVKTKQYPGRPTSPAIFYSHSPPETTDQQYGCTTMHRKAKTAYNCPENKGQADQIRAMCFDWGEVEQERNVGHDELVVLGLEPPTEKQHALLVHFQLKPIPIYESYLRHRNRRMADRPEDYNAETIYYIVCRALRFHHFYTTKPPDGFTENDFVALLPLDQVITYQNHMNDLVESTLHHAHIYNESHNLKVGPARLENLLSYTLEPYRPTVPPEQR